MRIAIFDPWSGISGNMVLGALLDAGLPVEDLEALLRRLPLEGWSLEVSRVKRGGLSGTLVEVAVPEERTHRHLGEITGMIRSAGLPRRVEDLSVAAFEALAAAEARVHSCTIEEVHFHETGAMDAILDIVGSFAGMHLLGVEDARSFPVATGWGTVTCGHGKLPVPAPATAVLLEGAVIRRGHSMAELTTPTGAAILTTLVRDWSSPHPECSVTGVGMGAGSRELEEAPNLLRIILGETGSAARWSRDECVEMVSLVDDMDPRLWPPLQKALLDAGAVDCYTLSGTGRKGRPALELTVLCPPEAEQRVLETLFEGSTTLGARIRTSARAVLPRRIVETATPWGSVRVKVALLGGRAVSAAPEMDDCLEIAEKAGVPPRRVLEAARSSALTLTDSQDA